jgi:hypothetical protein
MPAMQFGIHLNNHLCNLGATTIMGKGGDGGIHEVQDQETNTEEKAIVYNILLVAAQ